MQEGDEERVAVHEAGHAVAYLVIGRPVHRAVVADDEHQVDPVPGTSVELTDEAVAIVAGWAAEERRLRLTGLDEEAIYNVWLNGGHHDDRTKVEALAQKVDAITVEESDARAELLVTAHWDLILAVAHALLVETEIHQEALVAIAFAHGVTFEPGDKVVSRTQALVAR